MEVTSDLLAPVTKCTTCYPDFHTRPPNFKQLLNTSEFDLSGSCLHWILKFLESKLCCASIPFLICFCSIFPCEFDLFLTFRFQLWSCSEVRISKLFYYHYCLLKLLAPFQYDLLHNCHLLCRSPRIVDFWK